MHKGLGVFMPKVATFQHLGIYLQYHSRPQKGQVSERERKREHSIETAQGAIADLELHSMSRRTTHFLSLS